MRPFFAVLVLFLFVSFSANTFAVLPEAHLNVFAVAPDGTALAATLNLEIKPGSGEVWSSVSGPLVGTATQSTEKIAIKVARSYSNEVDAYDYFFAIDSDASVVDGPSAGSAMALLATSALQDRVIPTNVGLTGTITNTGQVGPVGGVFEKAKEASKNGIKLFMIPRGESRQVVKFSEGVTTIDLPAYALENWGMKIIETRNLDDVLHYAFTDIGSIDVNQISEPELPTFIPSTITPNETENPLGEMNKQFIQQTRDSIKQAQAALNQSLLDDSGLIEVLSKSLSDSEKTANEADLLTQNGYYYSAGNYAFLAKVNAYFVHDVAENPEILDLQSGKLADWAGELLNKIQQQQTVLNKTVPIEGVEWHIAAQQRLTWAEQKVDGLINTPTILVATPDAEQSQAVARVQDYEYARAWAESSSEFYSIALDMSSKSLKDQSPFKEYYSEYLKNVENGLTLVADGEGEDAQRRLDAANLDMDAGRHLSAAMNAASALALVNASLIQADTKNDIREKLEEKIAELETKLATSPARYAWARLYLDHADYFLQSADYYEGINQGTAAADSIASGYSLALLAENTYAVTKDVQDYYASLPPGRFSTLTANGGNPSSVNGTGANGSTPISISVGPDGKGSITIPSAPSEIPITGILLAAAVFLAVVLVLTYVARRSHQLNDARPPLDAMETESLSGSQQLALVDDLEARLFSARQGLRHARFQFGNGKLSRENYGEIARHYEEQMRGISLHLRTAAAELRMKKPRNEKTEMKNRPDEPAVGNARSAPVEKAKKSLPPAKKWPAGKASANKKNSRGKST